MLLKPQNLLFGGADAEELADVRTLTRGQLLDFKYAIRAELKKARKQARNFNSKQGRE